MSTTGETNNRPTPDRELADIAKYVAKYRVENKEAYNTARYCLMDSLGCALMALNFRECTKLLGPIISETAVANGARVPGTLFSLDPLKAAFDIGSMVRWLDFNDTWLAAEWGHPSDNLAGILAVADFLSRGNVSGRAPLTMRDVLTALIKAYEIQGVLALENSFNRVGLDHVILVKIASTAVVTHMLGGTEEQIVNAVSQALVDGPSLRSYRHAPNVTSRKSWAAGDATSRAVRLAMMSLKGEAGLPSVLTAPKWGFYDVFLKGNRFKISRPYDSYVVENILFKVSFPAEFHGQTAVECALRLHDQVKNRLGEIERIELHTTEPAIRIISKSGILHNPADRDHCLQYMVAVALTYGYLTAECYENEFARDPQLDALRVKMEVSEEPRFTHDYYDPDKRAIGNSVQVFFADGSYTDRVSIDYPIGHRRRRQEGIPLLEEKFRNALTIRFPSQQAQAIYDLCSDQERLEAETVDDFMQMLEA